MSSWVLDASAAIAFLRGEPGAARVSQALSSGAVMSAVNIAEVAARLAADDFPEPDIREAIELLRVDVVPFGEADAIATGLLRRSTRSFGLSLGDRACVALAMRAGLPTLTGDRAWRDIGSTLDVEVEVFR